MNAGAVPVVWMNALVDPEMVRTYFNPGAQAMEDEIRVKRELFHKAAVVQVCTEAEAARHADTFPDIADRFVPVPLFGPHLCSAPQTVLEKHIATNPVKLLFVGNQARRKGLRETLEAFMSLSKSLRERTTFTIVTNFDRGSVDIPQELGIILHRGLPAAGVADLMRESHVLINIARHESYGMVFLEAMSQGTLCLGPDWEVQRELFDYGRAGVNVRCQVPLIREGMLRAIEDNAWRASLAAAGWRRFNERYTPAIVAAEYAKLFRNVSAAGRS